MLQDLIGTILEYVRCLLLVYVKTYAKEFVSTDTFDQIVSLNQSTSGGVDQDHAVFHLLDGLAVNQCCPSAGSAGRSDHSVPAVRPALRK